MKQHKHGEVSIIKAAVQLSGMTSEPGWAGSHSTLYAVTLTEHRSTPILSASNAAGHGAAPPGCIVFNPSYIPSSATFNQSGLLVRLCCGTECFGHGMARSIDALPSERIGFAPCDLESGVCADVLPSDKFNLDPGSDSEDPRAFYWGETGSYYNFYYRQKNESVGRHKCTGPQCTVRLARTQTPLEAASWAPIGTYPWHRNGCCAMRPRGKRSYCIWGEGPGPFPGLGISYTTDIDEGTFTQVGWSVAEGVHSPLTSDGQYLLPLGTELQEVKLEAGTHLQELSTGDWLHFYAAATPGWVPDGNYTAGFVILDRDDPTRIIQRSVAHTMVPRWEYETLCNGAKGCKYRGERKNVIFLCSATRLARTLRGVDRFRLFFGGGDGNVGTAIVEVSPPASRSPRAPVPVPDA